MLHERPYGECTLEVISSNGQRLVALSAELDPGGRVVTLTQPEVEPPNTAPMEEWANSVAEDDPTYYALFFARLAAALVNVPMPRNPAGPMTDDQRIEWVINATDLVGDVLQPLCALTISASGQISRLHGLDGVARLQGRGHAGNLPWATWLSQARAANGQNAIRCALSLMAAVLPLNPASAKSL